MKASKVGFVPLNDNVLIRRDEIEEKVSPGGVVLPKKGQEVPVTCEVVAVGPGKPGVEMPVQAGQTVIVGRYSGTDIELDNDKYSVVRLDDILGIVESG